MSELKIELKREEKKLKNVDIGRAIFIIIAIFFIISVIIRWWYIILPVLPAIVIIIGIIYFSTIGKGKRTDITRLYVEREKAINIPKIQKKELPEVGYCPECGVEILDESKMFCPMCGKKLNN